MTAPRNGSLDILRATAIALVLACHFGGAFLPPSPLTAALGFGGRGVDLFFVLSGWLLGGQLFREVRATGTINIRRFWIRRWLRTLPAYYAIVFATWAYLAVMGKAHIIDLRYLVFLQNYLPESQTLGVTWSLCVEEHFYLLVAPLIVMAARWRWGVALVGLIFLAVATAHILGWYPQSLKNPEEVYASHIRCEQCAAGVMLAWLSVARPKAWAALCQWAMPLALLSLILVEASILNRTAWGWVLPDYGVAGWGLLFGTWILLAESSVFFRERLSSSVARFLAVRAYSLYLVHSEGVAFVRKLEGKWDLAPPAKLALALLFSFALAEILYRVVERPFMRRRGEHRVHGVQAKEVSPAPQRRKETEIPLEVQLAIRIHADSYKLITDS